METRINKLKTAVKSPKKSKGVEAIATDSDKNDDDEEYPEEESSSQTSQYEIETSETDDSIDWTCKLTCCVTINLYKKHMNFLPSSLQIFMGHIYGTRASVRLIH